MVLRSHLADLNYCGRIIEFVFCLSFLYLFFVSIPEAFKASGIELSPPPGSSGKIVSVRDKFARIVSVRDICCGGRRNKIVSHWQAQILSHVRRHVLAAQELR